MQRLSLSDILYMHVCLGLAHHAFKAGELPIGALVARDGIIIGYGWNQKELKHDPSAHAEINAVRMATNTCKSWRLEGSTVYVTKEPCVMCAGALLEAKVSRVVFGVYDLKCGALGSLYTLHDEPFINHKIAVLGGVEQERSKALLKAFFAGRRYS